MNTKAAVYVLGAALVIVTAITAERIVRLTREINALQESYQVVTNHPPATVKPTAK